MKYTKEEIELILQDDIDSEKMSQLKDDIKNDDRLKEFVQSMRDVKLPNVFRVTTEANIIMLDSKRTDEEKIENIYKYLSMPDSFKKIPENIILCKYLDKIDEFILNSNISKEILDKLKSDVYEFAKSIYPHIDDIIITHKNYLKIKGEQAYIKRK